MDLPGAGHVPELGSISDGGIKGTHVDPTQPLSQTLAVTPTHTPTPNRTILPIYNGKFH